jgi:hypothetical protein
VQYENTVMHDAAAFVNHWELTVCDPRAWRWRPWRAHLANVFLESFDRTYLTSKRLPFLWTSLHVMLGNWYEFEERRRSSLRHAYLERCFAAIVERMTAALHAAAREH